MTTTKSSILTFLFLNFFISPISNAQSLLSLVDRANVLGPTLAEGQGITVTGLTRGIGITMNSGGDFNSRSWTTSSPSLSNAKANNEYLEFSIQVDAGSLLDLNEMKIKMGRSGTGPNNVEIEYSTDAFSTTGSSVYNGTVSTIESVHTVTLTGITTFCATDVITFRIFAWGASSANGTFDIEGLDNTYTAQGWTPTISNPGIAIEGLTTPQNPTNISNTSVSNNSTTISWTNTNCFDNVIVIGGLSSISTSPSSSVNPSSWSSNADWNNKVSVGSQMAGGSSSEFVLYVGTGSSVNVTNLPTSGSLYYKVFTTLSSWSSGGPGSTPLPVELIDFDAAYLDDHIHLSWSTASELNNHVFEIQKSISGEDFIPIAEVAGSGTSHEIKHYDFSDYDVSPTAFYRLKQIDYDGTFSYSKIVRILNEENLISFSQDNHNVRVRLKKFIPAEVHLFLSGGGELLNDRFHESYSINKSHLATGLYVLVVRYGNQIHHYRFVK